MVFCLSQVQFHFVMTTFSLNVHIAVIFAVVILHRATPITFYITTALPAFLNTWFSTCNLHILWSASLIPLAFGQNLYSAIWIVWVFFFLFNFMLFNSYLHLDLAYCLFLLTCYVSVTGKPWYLQTKGISVTTIPFTRTSNIYIEWNLNMTR